MVQTQFISHARVTPPAPVPRNGIGLFGAMAIVLIVLGALLTGGLVVLEKYYAQKMDKANEELASVRGQLEIESIKNVRSLQARIKRAASLLDSHVYSSQVFNLLERAAHARADYTSFSYDDGKVVVGMRTPGYVGYAQQIKIMRGLPEVKEVEFSEPALDKFGSVSFTVTLTLDEAFIHTMPSEKFVPEPAPFIGSAGNSGDNGEQAP